MELHNELSSITIKLKHGWFAETHFGQRRFTLLLHDKEKAFSIIEDHGQISMKRSIDQLASLKGLLDDVQVGLYDWISNMVNELSS